MIRFLQSGNKAAKYILAGFLLVLTASMVTYLIPGFMSDTGTTQSGVVASVGGQDIHAQDVTRATQAQMRARHYPEQLMPYVAQQTAQSLIQQAEVRYEARRMGLKVSDAEIRDELQNGQYKEMFFPGGNWIGQQKYEDLLRENEISPDDFEKGMRDSLLSRKLFNTISASVSVSQSEVEQAYKEKNTKVKFQYALLNEDDIKKQVKPTEAEIKAYYEANKTRYQNSIPEKRVIRYFTIDEKDAENKVAVNASDLERYYSANQEQYRVPERAKVRHILIKTPPAGADGKVDQKAVAEARAKAEDVLKQVKAGGNFADLAKKYSQDPGSASQGGELGWIVKGQTVPEFEKTAFAQNPGQISDLVQTSYGFHIIQTEEKEPAHLKSLTEVKSTIEPLVKQQKASAVLTQEVNQAEDISQKQGLDKAAAALGAQVIQSNPVTRTDSLPGVGNAPEMMTEVFAGNDKSGPQSARTGQGYVMFEVTRIIPPATPSYEQVKDKIAAEFENQKASQLLRKKTQELSDRARAEHDLAKAAKEAGAVLKTSDLVGRTAQVPDIGLMSGPASVAFTMQKGEISGPLNLGQKTAVIAVTDRQEPAANDEQFAKESDQLREQLAQQKKQEVLELFMSNLDSRLQKQG
ncbi:MAG: peptidylprolyl isomerase, partial [Candidatus Angelobacter sp.]